jgi:protein-tyrosine sulfotransferase
MSDYEGIVVLGAPRSGTTLLRRLLNAHPDIACPAETSVLTASARWMREEPFGDDLSMGPLTGLSYAGFTEDQVLSRLREFAFGFLRDARDRAGKPIWAEKTAFDSFYVPEIARLCGAHVRYITIFRHGLDVACSIKDLVDRMGTHVEELHRYVMREPHLLDAYTHAWADISAMLRALATDLPGQVHAMRYEDLVEDPEGTLGGLFDGLGRPADPAAVLATAFDADVPGLGDWKTYQRTRVADASVARWRGLDPGTTRRLARIANPMLTELGYEPVDEPPEVSAATARRRMQLSLLAARLKAGS